MRPAWLVLGALIAVAVVVGHDLARQIQSLESWITQPGLPGMMLFVSLGVGGASRAAYRGVLRETNLLAGI